MEAAILPIATDPTLEPEATTNWQHAHERIVALGRERAGHERLVCRWLLCAERLGVHARCGYASLREYAERMLGISARQTEERLRVGRALTELPELDGALASGRLSWSAVRELTRIANEETECSWIEWADGRRVHEVESAVSEHAVGDGPDSPSDPTRVIAEMVMCDAQHLGVVDGPHAGAERATQTIPKAIRRKVVRRDRKRCIVPGCRHFTYLDVHHVDPRCEGGGHDPERLAVLCGSHHRAIHYGRLWVDGKGSTGFVVRHAGGAAYGSAPWAPKVDAVTQAQSGLEQMGFKPTRARALIEAALAAGALDAAALLHEALRLS